MIPGNKKLNNQGIPKWVFNERELLSACIRGLVDTDGSIFYISKRNKNLRIDFTSYIPNLLRDTQKGLFSLGFNPSKVINQKHIFLSSKKDVNRYIKEIGFHNQKHLNRVNKFDSYAPIV